MVVAFLLAHSGRITFCSLLLVVGSGGLSGQGESRVQGPARGGGRRVFSPGFAPVAGVDPVTPTGIVQSDGTFELDSVVQGKAGKGAPAGEYVVTIIWNESQATAKKKSMSLEHNEPPAKDKLGGKLLPGRKASR